MNTTSHLSTGILMIKLFLFLIFLWNNLIESKEIFKASVSGIKCTSDPTIYKGFHRCYKNATRDRRGLTTIQYNFLEPGTDIWVQLKVFYKYTNGYRPWMVDYDSNYCNIQRGIEKPNLVNELILMSLKKHVPGLVHKCPYIGLQGLKDVDLPAVLNTAIPQLIPAGDYRLLLRMHLADNRTWMSIIISGHIDSVHPLDRMGMGKK